MEDVELMLRLIEVKASHYWGSAFTYAQVHFEEEFEGTPSALAREELYEAKCKALRDLVAELLGSMATAAQVGNSEAGARDNRYVFITEMAGTMTAAIKNTKVELDDAWNRFDRDHEAYFKDHGNAKSAWNIVEVRSRESIEPSEALSQGVLDVRLVLITEVNGELDATICDTEAELQTEIENFKHEYEDWIVSQDAVWTSHEIVVPPRTPIASPLST